MLQTINQQFANVELLSETQEYANSYLNLMESEYSNQLDLLFKINIKITFYCPIYSDK
ncbi:hypothetical protein [Mycoplasmopsis gallopavonis]|nr:hypothetical protein [Mycoplasmopsis gallopavonis]